MQKKAALPEIAKNSRIKTSVGDKVISVVTYVVNAFFAFVCVYPFYYIIINSISANNLSERGKIIFYPQEIHFKNYASVFNLPGLWDAARTSVLRTVIGTALTVMVSAFLGYMFTRKTLWHRKDSRNLIGRQAAVDVVVDHHNGRKTAGADAAAGVQRDAPNPPLARITPFCASNS